VFLCLCNINNPNYTNKSFCPHFTFPPFFHHGVLARKKTYMIATTTTYSILTSITTGLIVPLFISILSVAWLIGIMIKAMKSRDLV